MPISQRIAQTYLKLAALRHDDAARVQRAAVTRRTVLSGLAATVAGFAVAAPLHDALAKDDAPSAPSAPSAAAAADEDTAPSEPSEPSAPTTLEEADAATEPTAPTTADGGVITFLRNLF